MYKFAKLIHTIVIIKAILAASLKHRFQKRSVPPFYLLLIFLDTRDCSA